MPPPPFFFQGDHVHKSVFIIFFQGDQLKNRVKKICEGYESIAAQSQYRVTKTKENGVYMKFT